MCCNNPFRATPCPQKTPLLFRIAFADLYEISIASVPLLDSVTAPSPPMKRFSNSDTN
jgi:hypothetical protein